MHGRAWLNAQLSMEPKKATRRRAEARAAKDEMDQSEWIRLLHPHVEDTGEVVR